MKNSEKNEKEQLEEVTEISLLEDLNKPPKILEINVPIINKIRKDITNEMGNHTIATYSYTNEEGKELYRILRRTGNGEKFLVSYIDENGLERFKFPEKIKPVPYNLVGIRKAIENNQIIWIVEGESKADTMNKMGFTCTSCPFKKPDKWSPAYNKYLEGAKGIIILQDNDYNGMLFAEYTSESILDSVENIELSVIRMDEICHSIKEGGDIDDLIDIFGVKTVKKNLKDIEAKF